MITYAILIPDNEMIGTFEGDEPTIEVLFEVIAKARGLDSGEELALRYPGLSLGFAPIH